MPLDSVSLERLKDVNPALAAKITQLATILTEAGVDIRVTQGLRTWEQQDELYAQGRTLPGKIVTNARGGESWHEFGVAVDVVPMDQEPPKPDWDVSHPVWQNLVSEAQLLGLTSGSCFHSLKDWPHLQEVGRFPVGAPDDEARQIWTTQGKEAFWNAVNA
jgi:peptidoglycan LD-endopeptidase CwlK